MFGNTVGHEKKRSRVWLDQPCAELESCSQIASSMDNPFAAAFLDYQALVSIKSSSRDQKFEPDDLSTHPTTPGPSSGTLAVTPSDEGAYKHTLACYG